MFGATVSRRANYFYYRNACHFSAFFAFLREGISIATIDPAAGSVIRPNIFAYLSLLISLTVQ